jgi:hypothetical protein
MAGMINLSLTQQLDEFGEPLSGGQLYIIQAGTVSTPQNAYQDEALTIPTTNPIVLDAAGRIPQFFLADGQIKVRLQDRMGVVKFVADNLLVIGPSSGGGGGGGGAVDPTTVLQTGDIKIRYDTAILTGFVRLNGLTIGSSTSGATELADPTAQALFQYLWGADSTLVVSGGRGANAAADWAANKRLTLPDGRARLLAAVDGMGGPSTNYWTGTTFQKGSATVMGSLGGKTTGTNVTLTTQNLPAYTPSGTIAVTGHVGYTVVAFNVLAGGTTLCQAGGSTPIVIDSETFTGTPQGGTSTAFNTAPPVMFLTVYMKL